MLDGAVTTVGVGAAAAEVEAIQPAPATDPPSAASSAVLLPTLGGSADSLAAISGMLPLIVAVGKTREAQDGTTRTVVHLLSTAKMEGTAQATIVAALAQDREAASYRFEAWFLNEGGPLMATLESAGVPCRFVDFGGARDMIGAIRFSRALREVQPDLVHMHVGGRARVHLIRRLSQAQIVAHLHGTHSEDGRTIAVGTFVSSADAVIANSIGVAGAAAPGAEVIPPGVNIPPETASAAPERPTVGAMSRLESVKRLADLVEAAGRLERTTGDFMIEIAGAGSEEPHLRAEVAAAGLGDHVEFLGWRTDLMVMFNRWSVFVSTSAFEGFGLSVLEAMAAGLPVVATRTAGSCELVDDGKTGYLVDVGNIDQLASRIELLLTDSDLRTRMGAAARRRAEECFSVRLMVDRTIAMYDRLLAPRAA